MSFRLIVLLVVILSFGALTTVALLDVGYWGIVQPGFQSWAAGQVLADLVILGVLACFWMAVDAPRRGLPAWPFILITILAGSFGVLFYLVARELRPGEPAS